MNISEQNEEDFGLVLDMISKSALRLINKSEHELASRIILGENDPISKFVMGRILVGIYDQESDRKITSGISEILSASSQPLAESLIKSIVVEVREKCSAQLLCLQRANNDIEKGSTAKETLANIQELL